MNTIQAVPYSETTECVYVPKKDWLWYQISRIVFFITAFVIAMILILAIHPDFHFEFKRNQDGGMTSSLTYTSPKDAGTNVTWDDDTTH